jgi:hypothetical protein
MNVKKQVFFQSSKRNWNDQQSPMLFFEFYRFCKPYTIDKCPIRQTWLSVCGLSGVCFIRWCYVTIAVRPIVIKIKAMYKLNDYTLIDVTSSRLSLN